MIRADDSPKCFNRNVLITGVERAHGENRQLFSDMYVTLDDPHTQLLPLMLYKEHSLYWEQGDRVTWWLDRSFYIGGNQRVSGPSATVKVSLSNTATSYLLRAAALNRMQSCMFDPKNVRKKIAVIYTPLVV